MHVSTKIKNNYQTAMAHQILMRDASVMSCNTRTCGEVFFGYKGTTLHKPLYSITTQFLNLLLFLLCSSLSCIEKQCLLRSSTHFPFSLLSVFLCLIIVILGLFSFFHIFALHGSLFLVFVLNLTSFEMRDYDYVDTFLFCL